MFFQNSLAFLMIQQMLAIWFLVPLPFLHPAWTSGSSRFTCCWSLAWRILSITLLVCAMLSHFSRVRLFGNPWTVVHQAPLVRLCSKFSKLGFNSTWTENFQMFKLDLEKAEEPEIKLPTFAGSRRKQGTSRKTSASLATLKPLTVWITTNSGKFLMIWEHQTTLPASWEICM